MDWFSTCGHQCGFLAFATVIWHLLLLVWSLRLTLHRLPCQLASLPKLEVNGWVVYATSLLIFPLTTCIYEALKDLMGHMLFYPYRPYIFVEYHFLLLTRYEIFAEHPELYKDKGVQDNGGGSRLPDASTEVSGRRQAATDEFMLDRFRKRERHRVMRR